tara:strand:- start:66 stop:587 length:522 start_codon:yes stop_codon:yes gene_type:complete
MRWSTFSLGGVLAKTQIWSGEQIDVVNGNFSNKHLEDDKLAHPLHGKCVIGDLEPSQLRESTLRSAIRTVERVLNLSPDVLSQIAANRDAGWRALLERLRQLCPNNVWYEGVNNIDRLKSDAVDAGSRIDEAMRPPVVGSSVEDVAVALQAAILGTIGSGELNIDTVTIRRCS